jgi:DNA-binding winged helix-turn-helix (wHTH) protein
MATFRFASYVFDEQSGLAQEGKSISLSPLQHRLLYTFCSNPNTLLSKTDLIEAVWNHSYVSEVSLARTVHELRQRLGGGHGAKQLIVSVYGRGYVFQPQGASTTVASSFPASSLHGAGSSPTMVAAVS